LTIKFRR